MTACERASSNSRGQFVRQERPRLRAVTAGTVSERSPRASCESGAMSTSMQFDEDMTRRIVELYTTPDVVAQRDATLEILDPQQGERVLDIGSGPGFLVAGIAGRVGESGAVSGIDL